MRWCYNRSARQLGLLCPGCRLACSRRRWRPGSHVVLSFMLCCAMQRNGLIVLDTGYGWYSGEVLEGTSRFHTNPKVYGLQPVKCRHSG